MVVLQGENHIQEEIVVKIRAYDVFWCSGEPRWAVTTGFYSWKSLRHKMLQYWTFFFFFLLKPHKSLLLGDVLLISMINVNKKLEKYGKKQKKQKQKQKNFEGVHFGNHFWNLK